MAISIDYANPPSCLLSIFCDCQFITTGRPSFPQEDLDKNHLLPQLSENDADGENYKDARGQASISEQAGDTILIYCIDHSEKTSATADCSD